MTETPEPITIQKAASGLVDPKNTIKSLIFNFHTLMLVLVVLGGIHLWQMIFPPSGNQKQTTVIKVARGASVGSITTAQDQNKQKKTVGLEVFGSTEKGGLVFKKYFNDNMYAGIGGAWVFQGEDKGNVVPEIRVGFDF